MENGEDQESHGLENSFTPQEENFHSNVAPRALNLRLAAALLKCHSTRLRNVNDLDDDKILNQFLGRSTIRKLRQLLQLGQCRELEAHRHDKNIFDANGRIRPVRGARIKAAFRKIPGIKKAAAPLSAVVSQVEHPFARCRYKLGYKSVEDLQKALRNGNKDFMRVMERFYEDTISPLSKRDSKEMRKCITEELNEISIKDRRFASQEWELRQVMMNSKRGRGSTREGRRARCGLHDHASEDRHSRWCSALNFHIYEHTSFTNQPTLPYQIKPISTLITATTARSEAFSSYFPPAYSRQGEGQGVLEAVIDGLGAYSPDQGALGEELVALDMGRGSDDALSIKRVSLRAPFSYMFLASVCCCADETAMTTWLKIPSIASLESSERPSYIEKAFALLGWTGSSLLNRNMRQYCRERGLFLCNHCLLTIEPEPKLGDSFGGVGI
eukprot:jgi/Bigna1/83694/fgenesh1_pg.113_\